MNSATVDLEPVRATASADSVIFEKTQQRHSLGASVTRRGRVRVSVAQGAGPAVIELSAREASAFLAAVSELLG